jgi:hypothetical protein
MSHRLNMELNLQSLFWLHVYNCTHCLDPQLPPPPLPKHLRSYTRAQLVSQYRRHLLVIPCVGLYSLHGQKTLVNLFEWSLKSRSYVETLKRSDEKLFTANSSADFKETICTKTF